MFALDAVIWWYKGGWSYIGRRSGRRLKRVADMFSVVTLLKTLFSPYRETYSGKAQGSLSDRLHALGDTLISRCIGLIVRICVIFIAVISLIVTLFITIVSLVIWPFIPLLPIIGLVLTAMNWTLHL